MKAILILIVFIIAVFYGCNSSIAPIRPESATISKVTSINKNLISLPIPKERIVVAVYKFRDQTGQYKLSSSGTSWSTAVTQGATSILMKALEESNWFIPIEREGLPNLLNERKIIRSSRANYKGSNGEELPSLPPLLYAGVILEGGIISYETNIVTGGTGLKYFGTGGSNQYREDKVTIYLRAISTQNGRVLKTVTTSKTILSQMLDVNLFKYVEFKKLLEIETGYSYNEPVDMCVTEAIEKAVCSLIIEGIIDKLWFMRDTTDSILVNNYMNEKHSMVSEDYTGKVYLNNNSFGIELGGGVQMGMTDYSHSVLKGHGSIGIKHPLSQQFSLCLIGSAGRIGSDKYFYSNCYSLGMTALYNFAPFNTFNPYLYAGTGVMKYYFFQKYGDKHEEEKFVGFIALGIGTEYFINDGLSFNVKFENNIALSDKVDGISHGKWYDSFWVAKIGFCIYPLRWK